MPLNTVRISGNEPAKRKAQEATLLSGRRCLSRATRLSFNLDRRPPKSGSIMMAGIPRLASSP